MSFTDFPNALFQGSILHGRYIIKDVLGQGGFGITYKALDYQTREYVAIKEYFPSMIATRNSSYTVLPQTGQNDHDFEYGKSQFLEEAKTLSEFIDNPAVVKVYSYFEDKGTAYFVMEYLEGVSLSEYLRKKGGRIPWHEVRDLLMPLMDALSAVHEKNIVHRDIKPDNIIITNDGLTKLLDFGAARYVYGIQSHSLDTTLTPGFAPFEQYFRRGHQGPWTDVYALAATMYCAITGTVPPEAVERSYKDNLTPPSSMGVAIPDYAEAAILKALTVHEDKRYRNMCEFKSAMLNGMRREEEEKRKKEQEELRRKEEEKRRAEEEKKREQQEVLRRQEEERRKKEEEKLKKENKLRIITLASVIISAAVVVIFLLKLSGAFSDSKNQSENNAGSEQQIAEQTERKDLKEANDVSDDSDNESLPSESKGTVTADDIKIYNSEDGTDDTDTGTRQSDDPIALTDSWEQIIAAGKDGTYKDRYRIGDTKELDLGEEGIIHMKLVAMDADELADGSGKAPMTWIAEELLKKGHYMNPTAINDGGWPDSDMRAWLQESILPIIPENVRSNIKEVTKYSYSFSDGDTISSKDTIWIPSSREIFGGFKDDHWGFTWERLGPQYASAFPNDESRQKHHIGTVEETSWWLRSAYPDYDYLFEYINSDGEWNSGVHAFEVFGIAVGFCI